MEVLSCFAFVEDTFLVVVAKVPFVVTDTACCSGNN